MNAVLDNDVVEAVRVLPHPLVAHFDTLAGAPGGIMLLRELILTLAVQGKLVPQDRGDLPASALIEKSRAVLLGKSSQRRRKSSRETEVASSDTSLPDLPNGWSWCKGSDIYSVVRGVTYQKQDARERSMENYTPILRANNIRGSVNFDDLVYVPSHLVGTEQLLQSGDFVVCLASGSKSLVGKAAIFSGNMACSFGAFCGVIRPSIDLPFLSIFLSSPMYRNEVSEASSGIGINNLKSSTLLDLAIPLPPEAEQTRIVDRVHELMRLCDALEEKGKLEDAQHAHLLNALLGMLTDSQSLEDVAINWRQLTEHFDLLLDRPEAVDALEQAFLQLAISGLLVEQDADDEPVAKLLKKIQTEKAALITAGRIRREKPAAEASEKEKPFPLPDGWQWVSMGQLVNGSEAGWSPSCDARPRREGHWGVLKVSAVSWGEFDAEANKELPLDLTPRPEYEVHEGDFLLSRANTAELVARSVVVRKCPAKLMLSDKLIRLDVSRHVDRNFLNMANNALHSRAYYAANASGTSSSMKNVSREVVLSLPVALPPYAEQERIVKRVTELRRLCTELRKRLVCQLSVQSKLADVLVEQAEE